MEARGPEAYLKQYVEGPERRARPPAHHGTRVQACRSSDSAIAVEAFMNNAGEKLEESCYVVVNPSV